MKSELIEYCRYLCDVLNFRDYIEIPDDRKSYFSMSGDEFHTGKLLETGDRRKLLEARSRRDSADDKDIYTDVVIIPKVVCDMIPKYSSPRTKGNGDVWEYKRTSLLYLKTKLNRESFLLSNIPGESVVWADPLIQEEDAGLCSFMRKVLKKIFGKADNGRRPRFVLKKALPIYCPDGDWEQYVECVDNHFKTRTGKSVFDSDTLTDNQGISHILNEADMEGQFIVMADNTVFATKQIESLVSQMETEKDFRSSLFKTMILGNAQKKILNSHRCGENVDNHLGQMKKDFPLANAQRDVVHCMSEMKDGDVLAVSGPPGTGKTTMLQSIVADLIVKQIVDSGSLLDTCEAPLILAASSNNKAITNIIDAFSSGNESISDVDVHRRWICYSDGEVDKFVPMAVYCPSSSAMKRMGKEYFITDVQGGQNYHDLRVRYYEDSSDFYRRAQQALGLNTVGSVDDIMSFLRQKIRNIYLEIREIGHTLKATGYSLEHREKKDRELDQTLRYDLYWFSVHYNECRWIKKIEGYRDDKFPKRLYGRFLWDELRYICPCVVSTFYMAPKLFEYKSKGEKRYNFGLADLLIVDEAGQVSPEIGLPAFALAKRALVVGDVNQIPPVYSVAEDSEEKYWTDSVHSEKLQKERELLSCCQTSIMAIAEQRCQYERITRYGRRMPGLFLCEHRRCVNEIIHYSNELIYGGDLLPLRGSYIDKCVLKDIAPIGYVHIDGTSEMKEGSRFNSKEIEEIAKWLSSNEDKILAAYSSSTQGEINIHKLVSIITPFKAQSALIKKNKYLRNFPCGTVHTFQGAESPIVIFSLVYGRNDNPVFIKNNHELMNVAVSRAKDHFLIFGNMKCLENNRSDMACRLLCQKSKKVE